MGAAGSGQQASLCIIYAHTQDLIQYDPSPSGIDGNLPSIMRAYGPIVSFFALASELATTQSRYSRMTKLCWIWFIDKSNKSED
jgi:hypothetical protein